MEKAKLQGSPMIRAQPVSTLDFANALPLLLLLGSGALPGLPGLEVLNSLAGILTKSTAQQQEKSADVKRIFPTGFEPRVHSASSMLSQTVKKERRFSPY